MSARAKIANLFSHPIPAVPLQSADWYADAMHQLVEVSQELSLARDQNAISAIVRTAARKLIHADGASFVLRDGNQCYYADEDAITPLWKGRRFPMESCVSGWVMNNAKPAIIENIYEDERVPIDAYRLTFIKSLAMVPIRRKAPLGAIGNYWAKHYVPTQEEINVLQALADMTSLALENAQLYATLQNKVHALQDSNNELSRFAWVASHDLKEPLKTISGQLTDLEEMTRGQINEQAMTQLSTVSESIHRVQRLVNDLLVHGQVEKVEDFRNVSLEAIFQEVCKDIEASIRLSGAHIELESLPELRGNPSLLSRLFQNLLTNAIAFRRPSVNPEITVSSQQQGCEWIISVEDNGIGIEEHQRPRIFNLFEKPDPDQRSGISLATCRKIVELHGGKIWVEQAPGHGSFFRFTLPSTSIVN